MGITAINSFSKKSYTHELKLNSGEVSIPLSLIVFEGEKEYRSAAKPTDTMSGDIVQIFHNTESCFFRDTIFLAKKQNPALTHFIIRKK